MWQELVLVHRETGEWSRPLQGTGTLWRTCLRELLFLAPGSDKHGVDEGAQTFRGIAAHRLLVEICSGLMSPLFGETEVFGQFRSFRDAEDFDLRWEALFDAVEEDVRKVRRAHLTGIGSQSYGSLARKHLPPRGKVVIVGAGRLARDLLPWLEGCTVTMAARDPAKAGLENPGTHVISLASLSTPSEALTGASWLLAAPVPNTELLQSWKANTAALVLDFRGEQRFPTTPAGTANYIDLRALFQELESAKLLHEKKRAEATAFARELSHRREHAVVHRPYGWEDAFA